MEAKKEPPFLRAPGEFRSLSAATSAEHVPTSTSDHETEVAEGKQCFQGGECESTAGAGQEGAQGGGRSHPEGRRELGYAGELGHRTSLPLSGGQVRFGEIAYFASKQLFYFYMKK